MLAVVIIYPVLLSGDKLLLFGGISEPRSQDCIADIIIFSLRETTWSTLACTGQRPPERFEAVSTQVVV